MKRVLCKRLLISLFSRISFGLFALNKLFRSLRLQVIELEARRSPLFEFASILPQALLLCLRGRVCFLLLPLPLPIPSLYPSPLCSSSLPSSYHSPALPLSSHPLPAPPLLLIPSPSPSFPPPTILLASPSLSLSLLLSAFLSLFLLSPSHSFLLSIFIQNCLFLNKKITT